MTHFLEASGPPRHHLPATPAPLFNDLKSPVPMNLRPLNPCGRFYCETRVVATILRFSEAEVWTLIVARRLQPVGVTREGRPFFDGAALTPLSERALAKGRLASNLDDQSRSVASSQMGGKWPMLWLPVNRVQREQRRRTNESIGPRRWAFFWAPPRSLFVPEQAGTGALQRAPILVPLRRHRLRPLPLHLITFLLSISRTLTTQSPCPSSAFPTPFTIATSDLLHPSAAVQNVTFLAVHFSPLTASTPDAP